MADTSGMAEIRGIDIDKVAKGFADELSVFKGLVTVSTTSAREIRWYKKTSGFLDTTDTTGMTASRIGNVPQLALPEVIEQSWTRQTSYVRKYFAESPWISEEDIRDSDIDVLGTNVRDVTRAVENQVDARIWNVMTESQSAVDINSTTTTAVGGDQWDAASAAGNPPKDIMDAKRQIRVNGYDPNQGGVLFLSPKDEMSILDWVYTKGAQAPQFGNLVLANARIIEFMNLRVVVSTNVTADFAAVAVPQRAVTWKSFMPVTAAIKTEELIGRKIRVAEEGEALLTDPKAVTLIIDTQT